MSRKNKSTNFSSRIPRMERLDNTANLFPVIAGESLTNVYRISAMMTELVNPELLQKALDIVLPKFDGFNLRMRQGMFWYYMEENGKPAPIVTEENTFPCRFIRQNKNNSYMFRVTYYKKRINLEVFHVLADGMGGITFLKELVYQYLRLLHPTIAADDTLSVETSLNREDSFLKNYKRSAQRGYQRKKAYIVKGERLPNGEFGVMHAYMSVSELKKVCKTYSVSINEYLVSAYVYSVYTEFMHKMPSERPIRIAVPVNLRPYYQSNTTKNFFVMISAEFHPTKDDYSFSEICQIIHESLQKQMDPERLEKLFSYNVSNEKIFAARMVPLAFKNMAMAQIYSQSALANTTTITNIGNITVEEPYEPYIDSFHAYLAMSKGQHVKGAICSYKDKLVFSFSYDLLDVSIQKGFVRQLSSDGIEITVETNGVSYE